MDGMRLSALRFPLLLPEANLFWRGRGVEQNSGASERRENDVPLVDAGLDPATHEAPSLPGNYRFA
jgi:hypothetical protein